MEILNLSTNQLNQNGYTKNTLTKGKIGALYTFPTLYTPDDCLPCEGYSLSISDYKDLYRVVGTQFNKAEDEVGTFRIPDYNITKRFLQPGTDVGVQVAAGLPIHTHTLTMNRTSKSGNDTKCVWSYAENREGTASITSSAPSNSIYGKSSTVQPPSQIVHICIKYK